MLTCEHCFPGRFPSLLRHFSDAVKTTDESDFRRGIGTAVVAAVSHPCGRVVIEGAVNGEQRP